MKSLIKLILVVLFITNYVQGVSLLRKEKASQLPILPGAREAKHRFLILLQGAYDDYAMELAEDPFPQPTNKNEKVESQVQGVKTPVFIPDGDELPEDEEVVEELDLTKEELESVYVPPSPEAPKGFEVGPVLNLPPNTVQPTNNELEEAETYLSGSNLAKDAISDKLYGETDFQNKSVGSGDYQSPNTAFEGDPTLTKTEIAEAAIESSENGKALETELEKETPPAQQVDNGLEENEGYLSGSQLAQDAINDKLNGESDFSGKTVGSGDYQFPNQAFKGDETLSQADIAEKTIQTLDNGAPVETDLKTSPSQSGLEEETAYLTGGKLTQQAVTEKLIEDKMDDSYGIDLPVDTSLDGNKKLKREDILENQIQQQEEGKVVETDLDTDKPEEPALQEQRAALSGGTLTENAIWEKLAEHHLKDEYNIVVPEDTSLNGDKTLSKQDIQENSIQSSENGQASETDLTPAAQHVFTGSDIQYLDNDQNVSNGLQEQESLLNDGDLTQKVTVENQNQPNQNLSGDQIVTQTHVNLQSSEATSSNQSNGLQEQDSFLSGSNLTSQVIENNNQSNGLNGDENLTRQQSNHQFIVSSEEGQIDQEQLKDNVNKASTTQKTDIDSQLLGSKMAKNSGNDSSINRENQLDKREMIQEEDAIFS